MTRHATGRTAAATRYVPSRRMSAKMIMVGGGVIQPSANLCEVGCGQAQVWIDSVQQRGCRMVCGDPPAIRVGEFVVEPYERATGRPCGEETSSSSAARALVDRRCQAIRRLAGREGPAVVRSPRSPRPSRKSPRPADSPTPAAGVRPAGQAGPALDCRWRLPDRPGRRPNDGRSPRVGSATG